MSTPTGEVFRTDVPSGTNTYWRLYHKGAEYGNFFHVNLTTELNVNATQGRLRLLTASMVRAQLNADGLPNINGFNTNTDGFMGISGRPSFFNTGVGPFTRLHLVDNAGADQQDVWAQVWGFRPWQRNGVTFTGNSDQSYVGQKYNAADVSDIVVQWSNPT